MTGIAIIGPGGVGGLLGALLTRAGHDVVYVARPETAAVLNAGGMSLRSVRFGDFTVPAVAESVLSTPVEFCIAAPKATTLSAALDRVPSLGDALLLPLLNGVDHMAVLRSRYGADRVVAGSISVESTRVAPGRIEHTSPFCALDLAPPQLVGPLADLLRGAGLDVTVRPSEAAVLWRKLALLAPLALITTAARASIGPARESRRADLTAVVHEVAAVARAAGAEVDPAGILSTLEQIPPGMKSSMLRDAEAGRPIELDAIGGSVLHAGARLGVATPATARIVAELSG